MQVSRGDVHTPGRYSQLRDYSGLVFGNITPTDVDGLIEFHNKGYVILELKHEQNTLPYGQKLALERLTDDLALCGKKVICIISTHKTKVEDKIDAAITTVLKFRYNRSWREPKRLTTTKQLVSWFLGDFIDGNG